MYKTLRVLILFGMMSCISYSNALADEWMRRGVPNGDRFSCNLCHFSGAPSGMGGAFPLNGFGDDVRIYLRPSNYVKWSRTLASLDSDSDGYTNGEELQETTGSWRADFVGENRTNDGSEYDLTAGDPRQATNPGTVDAIEGGEPRVRFTTIEPDTVNVDETVRLTLSGSTSALGREVTFEFITSTTQPPEGATLAGDRFTWRPVFEQGGTHRILIGMTDGTRVMAQTFVVVVLGGATPPDPPEPPIAERIIPPVTDYSALRMDFDGNRRVGFSDFLAISGAFGQRDFRYDFDRDGFVGFRDILYFRYYYNRRVSTSITFRTPALDQHVFEPVTSGDIVYKNSETFLFERAHSDNILIGKYEVTNQQYFRFWDGAGRPAPRTPLAIDDVLFADYQVLNPDLPIVGVDFASAQAYCEWLGGRLPTWAEWVIAANGEEDRLYAHGNEVTPADANYFDSGDPFEPGPSPVGYYNGDSEGFETNDSFSKYAAYDMAGNVWEWVNRTRESFGLEEAAVMGGSFDDDPFGSALFSQGFTWEDVTSRKPNVGFRCARDQ
jgi:hypothetical protein